MENNYPSELNNYDLYFVDLDGCLIFEDLTLESFKAYFKQKPWNILYILYLLIFQRQVAKHLLAEHIMFEELVFHFNPPMLELINFLHKKHKILILATGSYYLYACQIASKVGLFDKVLATDLSVNLIGHNKLNKMLEYAAGKKFVYIGNSRVDLKVWKKSPAAIVVNASDYVKNHAKKLTKIIMEF